MMLPVGAFRDLGLLDRKAQLSLASGVGARPRCGSFGRARPIADLKAQEGHV